jgi:hypothetical protein
LGKKEDKLATLRLYSKNSPSKGVIKKEKSLSKGLVEYHFSNVDDLLDLTPEGTCVFYDSSLVSGASMGSITFQFQSESSNGTILVYLAKFKKNSKNKDINEDDVLLEKMDKYPHLSFTPGSIKVK